MDQLEIKMRQPHGKKLLQSLASDWQIYVLLLPVVIWFALWPISRWAVCSSPLNDLTPAWAYGTATLKALQTL